MAAAKLPQEIVSALAQYVDGNFIQDLKDGRQKRSSDFSAALSKLPHDALKGLALALGLSGSDRLASKLAKHKDWPEIAEVVIRVRSAPTKPPPSGQASSSSLQTAAAASAAPSPMFITSDMDESGEEEAAAAPSQQDPAPPKQATGSGGGDAGMVPHSTPVEQTQAPHPTPEGQTQAPQAKEPTAGDRQGGADERVAQDASKAAEAKGGKKTAKGGTGKPAKRPRSAEEKEEGTDLKKRRKASEFAASLLAKEKDPVRAANFSKLPPQVQAVAAKALAEARLSLSDINDLTIDAGKDRAKAVALLGDHLGDSLAHKDIGVLWDRLVKLPLLEKERTAREEMQRRQAAAQAAPQAAAQVPLPLEPPAGQEEPDAFDALLSTLIKEGDAERIAKAAADIPSAVEVQKFGLVDPPCKQPPPLRYRRGPRHASVNPSSQDFTEFEPGTLSSRYGSAPCRP
jgi:hypothetical protein